MTDRDAPDGTALGRVLAQRIRAEGPVPFPDFMAAALYDPDHGYYADVGFTTGRSGDFATAPDAGPLFGATLARPIETFAQAHDRPRLVELGPGSGRLIGDVLEHLSDEARDRLGVVLVEPFERRHEGLRAALERAGHDHAVDLVTELAGTAPGPTFLYANEVLDALPADVVRRAEGAGRWERLAVEHTDRGFTEAWVPVEDAGDGGDGEGGEDAQLVADPEGAALAAFLAEHASRLAPGHRYEACPASRTLLDDIAAVLDPGVAIVFDYGGRFEDIWPDRPEGTLRGFRDHRQVDPLERPGETDITYDVDLSMLAREARRAGLDVAARGEQARLLMHLGLVQVAREAGELMALKQLVVPGAFGGRFQTVVLDRGGLAPELGLAVDLDDPGVWDVAARGLADGG